MANGIQDGRRPARRVVIVGGVAGGMSAATRLRRLDEAAEITVLERGPYVSFANCGIPYHLGGEIADRQKLLVQTPQKLAANFRLDVRPNTEAIAIDRAGKTVAVRGPNGDEKLTYDQLILATGARAVVPTVGGINRPGHFPLRTLTELDAVIAWIQKHVAKTAVVLGGGFIGLEAAEQLHRLGLRVAVVEKNAQVLTPLDPEMAAHVHAELRKHNVDIHLSDPAVQFEDPSSHETDAASVVVLQSGQRLPADVVIVGIGVRPETTLAVAAGLKIGTTGGILVNDHLGTSDPDIYAVGDAIEVVHGVTGTPAIIPLAGPANRQGRIAADNICGIPSKYRGTIGTAIVRVFDIVAAVTGANEALLKRVGMPFQAVHLHPNSHAGYYPGAKSIAIKLLFDPASRRILGAQAVGADGVDKRIDVFATAIMLQANIDDLVDMELAYAPPFGSAKDPVNLAGMVAENATRGLVDVAQWHEVESIVQNGGVILDVREPNEREAGAIPGSLGIPLGKLRERLDELPRDRVVLVHCASGQRSYNACRLLTQHGYQCRNLTGSYKTWKAAQS